MILHPHDPNWALEFQRLRVVYEAALGALALAVEHVGSTAIRSIAAKPILDIDIVVANAPAVVLAAESLARLGYRHAGDQCVAGRETFKREDAAAPWAERSSPWMEHHLYVCVQGGRELTRHLMFRDYLNRDAGARMEYETIKRDIEARSGGNRRTYARFKEEEGACSAFVERILASARQ